LATLAALISHLLIVTTLHKAKHVEQKINLTLGYLVLPLFVAKITSGRHNPQLKPFLIIFFQNTWNYLFFPNFISLLKICTLIEILSVKSFLQHITLCKDILELSTTYCSINF